MSTGDRVTHAWSFAKEGSTPRDDVNLTLVRPFGSYTFRTSLSLVLASAAAYDWGDEQWTVPVVFGLSRVFALGRFPLELGVLGSYYPVASEVGPDWGLNLNVTFVFR